ncbi:MAG: hypothetical protein GY765_09730 [bacterium]|nr:hypothetical protein [bacterium]
MFVLKNVDIETVDWMREIRPRRNAFETFQELIELKFLANWEVYAKIGLPGLILSFVYHPPIRCIESGA